MSPRFTVRVAADHVRVLAALREFHARTATRYGTPVAGARAFRQALGLTRDVPRPHPAPYVGLARAFARRGKLRDAAEWLRKAPIPVAELHKLADDPDFAELRASRYSKDAFGF